MAALCDSFSWTPVSVAVSGSLFASAAMWCLLTLHYDLLGVHRRLVQLLSQALLLPHLETRPRVPTRAPAQLLLQENTAAPSSPAHFDEVRF